MSTYDYGTYGQTSFYVDVFKALALLGLNKVIFIYLGNGVYTKEAVVRSNIFATLAMGVVGALLCIISSPIASYSFSNPNIWLLVSLYSVSIPFQIGIISLSSVLVFENKTKNLSTISVLSNLLRYLLIIASIHLTHNLFILFIAILLSYIVQFIGLYLQVDYPLFSFKTLDKKHIFEQIKHGIPLGITSLLGTVYYFIDSFLVSTLLKTESYAVYRNGAFQVPFISSIYGIVSMVLLADITSFYHKRQFKEILALKRKVIYNSAGIIYPITIFFMVFSTTIINSLFSKRYMLSASVFAIYNTMTLFKIVDYEDLIVISKKTYKLPIIYGISVLLNIVLSLFLINWLGVDGAAWATILSFLFVAFVLLKSCASIIESRLIDFFDYKKLGLITLLSILATLPLKLLMVYFPINIFIFIPIMGFLIVFTYHLFLTYKLVDTFFIEKIIIHDSVPQRVKDIIHRLYFT